MDVRAVPARIPQPACNRVMSAGGYNPGMRNLILLLLGIAVGALGAASVVNALRQRDAYPRGLMQVMQFHYGQLRKRVQHGQCGATMQSDLSILNGLAGTIETAIYAGGRPEPAFHRDAERLRQALAAFPTASAVPHCADTATSALQRIGNACDTCHHAYR